MRRPLTPHGAIDHVAVDTRTSHGGVRSATQNVPELSDVARPIVCGETSNRG
jgi:hypothetical protein